MLRAKKRTGWNLSNAFAEKLYVSTRGVDVIDPCPLEIPNILLSPPPDPENGRSPRPTIGRLAQIWFALLPPIERPCSAVLIRSRVFTSSSRLRIVMLGYAILPPGAVSQQTVINCSSHQSEFSNTQKCKSLYTRTPGLSV